MIVLDFVLSSQWNRHIDDLTSVDEMSLRYDVLLGDVIFKVDECDFSTCWGWVPIVDFTASLKTVVNALSQGKDESSLDFTESDSAITFRKVGGKVVITASYTSCVARVDIPELVHHANALAKEVRARLGQQYPLLLNNAAFLSLTGEQDGDAVCARNPTTPSPASPPDS